MQSIEWTKMLIPEASPLEIVIRGTVMYLTLFTLLRVILKRQSGTLGMSDLLLVTLLADASQNAMAGKYQSLPDGILLAATLISWNYALDWLSFRFVWMRHLIEPKPLPLVQDGRINRKNLKTELITEEELRGQLRQQGIEDISRIRSASMEQDGRISVIEQKQKQHSKQEKKPS